MSSERVQPLVTYAFKMLEFGRARYSIRSLTTEYPYSARMLIVVDGRLASTGSYCPYVKTFEGVLGLWRKEGRSRKPSMIQLIWRCEIR
jgi:hypothetical protein